ncbi:beta-1,4-glucuronyltransferase 1-like isoform X2 [Venturia canescens]|uniref:beta-1,4-glucuronyltransferase 1-like isoform X2 n=1 Tax=Venturia canescens TaxID=32260 RepID=UPI001C9D4C6D|nr:beta-1,4-glucuronyltransferase 1-like isoform X2 [Venturia canescens]
MIEIETWVVTVTVFQRSTRASLSPKAEWVEPLTLEQAIKCTDKPLTQREALRGHEKEYKVLYNYVPMSKRFRCWQSVTYATNGDFTFLDNLEPLLDKWKAPISVALHAPGTDFQQTMDSIGYMRRCSPQKSLISQLVSFHLYYENKHAPFEKVPPSKDFLSKAYDCKQRAPWKEISHAQTFKNKEELIYPVNVGRNIAKEAALTHYILVADIEMYPSPNLATEFLEMIRRNDQPQYLEKNPKVFVLPPFEVLKDGVVPSSKTELVEMLNAEKAFPFHDRICKSCHAVPHANAWKLTPQSEYLEVSSLGNRTGRFKHWEPVYIGTADDPVYDERVTWDGQSDRRVQGWLLCALDYQFLILNDAFVVHRPGRKERTKNNERHKTLIRQMNKRIQEEILPEYRAKGYSASAASSWTVITVQTRARYSAVSLRPR